MAEARGNQAVRILLADDDDDDYFLTRRELEENRLLSDVKRVKDGEELMEYLRHQGAFSDAAQSPQPSLILLDLNMPRKDGREALREIKSDPKLRLIPVVVLTTSRAEEDVVRSYEYGVNSFITKPMTVQGLVDVIKELRRYWFEVVDLPT